MILWVLLDLVANCAGVFCEVMIFGSFLWKRLSFYRVCVEAIGLFTKLEGSVYVDTGFWIYGLMLSFSFF